ncbi:MAG: hypothetical protein ACOCY5_02025, partial [Desulfohalobiaceae bacterium]
PRQPDLSTGNELLTRGKGHKERGQKHTMNQTQNHGLQVYEQELSPEERQLLQICALIKDPSLEATY